MSNLTELVLPIVEELTEEYSFDSYLLKKELSERLGLEQLEEKLLVDQGRWYNRFSEVYGKDDEFVGILWNEGATEIQDDGIEPNVVVQRVVAEPSVKYVPEME